MRDIGKNIKSIRQAKGMTQDAMAEALFVTRQTVSNYENGRSRPDLDMLLRIAEVLETDVNTILYGPAVPQSKRDGYKWLARSGCVLVAVTTIYMVLGFLFPKDSYWGYGHSLRLINQLAMLPAVMFALGWFLTHCLSIFGGLKQLQCKKIQALRIIALIIFGLLAVIPIPIIIYYAVVAYCSFVHHSVSMTFPYIPVYQEAFKTILFMIGKIPFVYIFFGSVAWLLGLPKVRKP